MNPRGATGAARAPKLDKTSNTAARRRNLFYKIKVRPRSWVLPVLPHMAPLSYHRWKLEIARTCLETNEWSLNLVSKFPMSCMQRPWKNQVFAAL